MYRESLGDEFDERCRKKEKFGKKNTKSSSIEILKAL